MLVEQSIVKGVRVAFVYPSTTDGSDQLRAGTVEKLWKAKDGRDFLTMKCDDRKHFRSFAVHKIVSLRLIP
jgi:hypothetical protein